jgi:hypothetical protein
MCSNALWATGLVALVLGLMRSTPRAKDHDYQRHMAVDEDSWLCDCLAKRRLRHGTAATLLLRSAVVGFKCTCCGGADFCVGVRWRSHGGC